MEPTACPVYHPTKEEFEQPFLDYVTAIFRGNPDLPAFKVVPPAGWRPREQPFPALSSIMINTPIRQHAFGKSGAYRCMLVEHKPLTVEDFKAIAAEEEKTVSRKLQPPGCSNNDASSLQQQTLQQTPHHAQAHVQHSHKPEMSSNSSISEATHENVASPMQLPQSVSVQTAAPDVETTPQSQAVVTNVRQALSSMPMPMPMPTPGMQVDRVNDRSFWASVTLNPPLYGADTPISFFDEKLPYGWNIRDLGDLLRTKDVPEIPGVTTPMTYFGMWRSFFGWHKEDADLLSINYLHFGAPKVWYCVSPKHMDKFERMAEQLFPDPARACTAFIRHKDLLISPAQLRTYGIPYMQVKHNAGEFMVLNAAAYHAGFNCGFNCAEAINFATQDWIDVGKAANHCDCEVMRDVVRISMKLFDPDWSDSDDYSDVESGDSQRVTSRSLKPSKATNYDAARVKALSAAMHAARRRKDEEEKALEIGKAAGLSAAHAMLVFAYGKLNGNNNGNGAAKRPTSDTHHESTPAAKRPARNSTRIPQSADFVYNDHTDDTDDEVRTYNHRAELTPNPRQGRSNRSSPVTDGDSLAAVFQDMLRDPVQGDPHAIIWEDSKGDRYFHLVQQLQRQAPTKGHVLLRVLQEGPDGLFYPTAKVLEENKRALVHIRTQLMNPIETSGDVSTAMAAAGRLPAWKLLTLRSRLLEDTELI